MYFENIDLAKKELINAILSQLAIPRFFN